MPTGNLLLRRFDGVNLAADQREIADNQFVMTKDAWQPAPGRVALRPNTKMVFSTNIAPDAYWEHVNHALLVPYKDRHGYHWLLRWAETSAAANQYTILDLLPEMIDVSVPVVPTTLITSTAKRRPAVVVWRDDVYVFTGVDEAGYHLTTTVPGTIVVQPLTFAWSGTAGGAIYPTIACMYRDSLALAGMDGSKSRIRWTEVGDPLNLLVGTKAIDIPGEDPIVGLFEIPVIGGSQYVEPYLLVLKRNSIWMIHGSPPTSTANGDLSVTRLGQSEGLVRPETFCYTPFGAIWCSGKNVWIAPHNGAPQRIGDALAPMLKKLSGEAPYAWHAAYFDGHYRLAVPGTDPLAAGYTPTEEWWLDMREFPERATWWGPMMLPSAAMVVQRMSNDTERLLSLFYGGATSAVSDREVSIVEGGSKNEARYMDAHQFQAFDQGYAASRTWPVPELRFKEFDFGDPMLQKLVDAVELHSWSDGANSITIDMYGNGGAVSQSPTPLASSGAGFTLGTSTLGSALTKEFTSEVFYPPSSGRFLAKTWQPVLKSLGDVANETARDFEFSTLGVRVRPIGRRP